MCSFYTKVELKTKLIKVPKTFLKEAIKGCVEVAKEEGIRVIPPEFLDKIRDKRSGEKQEA